MLCLAIVGGLVLSDWAAKRRARNLLKIRDALKAQNRQTSADLGNANLKPAFRIFRWEFAVLAAAVVFFLFPKSQKSIPVEAKSPAPSTITNNVVLSSQAHQKEIETESATPPALTSAPVAATTSGIKSPAAEGTASVSVDALFEHRSHSDLEIQNSDADLRENYPISSGSFAPNGPGRDTGFSHR